MKFAIGSFRGEALYDAILALFDHERAHGEIRPVFTGSGKKNGGKGANAKGSGFAAPFHANEKATISIRGRVISKYKQIKIDLSGNRTTASVKVVQTFLEDNASKGANTLDSVFKIDTKAWKMEDSPTRNQEKRMLKLTESRGWG